jgi:hypothetical protein
VRRNINITPAVITAVQDGADSDAALERAKAEYQKEHPEWQGDKICLILVVSSAEVRDDILATISRLSDRG